MAQYLDNRFFSPFPQSSNVKGPEKRAENILKVKNNKKEREHKSELVFSGYCDEETKFQLWESEF